jgi:hypothetical protein
MWGRLTGQAFPDRLPDEAVELLREMECDLVDEEDIEDDWLNTLVDTPFAGPVREEIRSLATEVARV